jgi:phage-related protein
MRDLVWIGSSRKDIRDFPSEVKGRVGFALRIVQAGEVPENAKPLSGYGGAGVQEIVEDHDGNTYRAVYTVQLKHAVYVLHCFQKKSVKGRKTPQPDKELLNRRLKRAKEIDAEHDKR